MNTHHHLSSEEIFAQVEAGAVDAGVTACATCRAEADSLHTFLGDLRRADAALVATTEWDDLLLRRRIREAVAKEPAPARSIFDRFFILKPAMVSALAAVLVFAVWSPLTRIPGMGAAASVSPAAESLLPVWSPLPDESEDEGLAVLAEWTPTEDELAVAGCHGACLSGLSLHEEENLLHAPSVRAPQPPVPGGSPL